MNTREKLDLLKKNTVEILTEESLRSVLKKKQPTIYCGYEPSGPLHLGHFVTITKLMDFQKTGFKVKVLLADVHTELNRKKLDLKAWEKTFKAIGLKCQFVLGSSFQFKEDYQKDVMKLSQASTINRGLRAMQEVA
jgi:tyrosyl-tRNA synthetase